MTELQENQTKRMTELQKNQTKRMTELQENQTKRLTELQENQTKRITELQTPTLTSQIPDSHLVYNYKLYSRFTVIITLNSAIFLVVAAMNVRVLSWDAMQFCLVQRL